jgi:hypothetical protein
VAPGRFVAVVSENGAKLPRAPLQVTGELHANVAY